MQGYNAYDKTLTGLRHIRGDTLIADSASFTTLSATTLSAGQLISNLTQSDTHTIQQTGTGSNSLKDTAITNLTLSGTVGQLTQASGTANQLRSTTITGNLGLTGNFNADLIQSSLYRINQTTGGTANALKATTVTGTLTCAGDINQTSGTAALRSITQVGGTNIVQSGSGTGSGNTNTLRNIVQAGAHTLSQSGTGQNVLKDTQMGNLTMTSGASIVQSGSPNNALGSTTISDLIVSNTMVFPGTVTVPSATTSGDFSITGDGRLLQDLTSATVNQIKASNIKSISLESNLTQAAGVASLKSVTADSVDTKSFNLLDSGGAVVVSDAELRLLDGATSNIQAQISANTTAIATAQTDIATAQADITTAQTDITDLHTVNTAQQTQIDSLNTHATTNAVTLSGDQTVSDNKRFVNLRAEAFNLIDPGGSTVVSDARFRMLSTLSSNVQSQLDAVAAVNGTQQTELDDLRTDHDGHVSNAVTLTGDQTIGGKKTFSDRMAVGSNLIVHPTSPSPTATLSYALGTSNLAAASVAIPAYSPRMIEWTVPVNIANAVTIPLGSNSSGSLTDTLDLCMYTISDGSGTVASGNMQFSRTLPLTQSYTFSRTTTGIVGTHTFTIRVHVGSAYVSFQAPSLATAKTYSLAVTTIHSGAYSGSAGSSSVRSFEVNSAVFPIASPGTNQGTYHDYSSLPTSITLPSNIVTFFVPGKIGLKAYSPFTDGELVAADISCNSLVAKRLRLNDGRGYCAGPPAVLITGAAFANGTEQSISQNHTKEPIYTSMARLESINNDKAVVLMPGYTIALYKNTSWGSSVTTVQNDSQEIAAIRTNRLNTNSIAIYDESGTWRNIAAVNAGSYGQASIASVRLYYGSMTSGNAVELTNTMFN